MHFPEAVSYLSTLHAFGWRLDLSRMEALCERLGRPERAFRAVHVAGTNGKGSTTALIASILAHAGNRVGAYFSPYVFNVRERVMLAEPNHAPRMIPEDDFARLMTQLRPHVEAVGEDAAIGHPTEFEVKTALAFLYFREKAVDWAVLEVGLGGRLDATNVIPPPEACVITNIGLDHTDRLGETLEKIAGEKAGIIKPGCAVLTGAEEPALGVIRQVYEQRGGAEWGDLRCTGGDCVGHLQPHGVTVSLRARPGLPGAYQERNALLAQMTAVTLSGRGVRISEDAISAGIASAFLPGRFQIARMRPTVVLDGAHNREGAEALARSLARRFPDQRFSFIIGMMGRHPVDGVVAELAPLAARITATQPSQDRAHDAERVQDAARAHGFHAPLITPPMAALNDALANATPSDVVVVTGSFYTVGEVDVDALRETDAAPQRPEPDGNP